MHLVCSIEELSRDARETGATVALAGVKDRAAGLAVEIDLRASLISNILLPGIGNIDLGLVSTPINCAASTTNSGFPASDSLCPFSVNSASY